MPLRYDRPQGPTIGVAVVVVKSRAAHPRGDALLITGGGPGDSIIDLVPQAGGPASPLGRFAPDRDVIWYNQRGTRYGSPELQCPEVPRSYLRWDVPSELQLALVEAADRSCGDRLRRQGIDLAAYGTVANAKDLDAVRAALGYSSLDLWGTSYGTRLVLEAMRQAGPRRIRTAILSSPVPAQVALPEAAPAAFQHGLDELFLSCRRSAPCSTANGDLRAALDRAVARLARAPHPVRTSTASGRPVTVVVDAPRVADTLFQLLYTPKGVTAAPGIIAAAGRGNDAPIAAIIGQVAPDEVTGVEQAAGMQRVVWCNDIVSQATRAGVARAAALVSPVAGRWFHASAVNGPTFGQQAFDACRNYGTFPWETESRAPVRSQIPALVQVAQFDPITPPALGRLALRTLPHGQLLDAAGYGHSALFQFAGGCSASIVQQFLDDPLRRVDALCVTRPPAARTAPATAGDQR